MISQYIIKLSSPLLHTDTENRTIGESKVLSEGDEISTVELGFSRALSRKL